MANETPVLTKVLAMKFTDGSRVRTISLTNPKDDLTADHVQAVMELIANLNPFIVFDFQPVVKSAQFIQKSTTNFGLTID